MHLRKEAIAAGLLIVFLSIALLPGSVATAGDVPGSKPPGESSVPTVQNGLDAQAEAPALPRVLVLVNSDVYPSISAEINQYIADLQADSPEPDLVVGTFATPEDLRNFLITKHDEGVIGTALVGDFPSAWYEVDYPSQQFPCDIFLEDLDGTWTDSDSDGKYDTHTDTNGLEMWVGRIKGSGMTLDGATEIGLLSNYFRKDHAYRTGALTLPGQSLVYIDDDWWVDTSCESAMRLAYPGSETTVVKDPDTTVASDYLSRITNNGYQWILVVVHGNPHYHNFKFNNHENSSPVSNYDIKTADPHAFFYNLVSCSTANYTQVNCIGNWYVMCDTYGLGVVGPTKPIPLLKFDDLYSHVRDGCMLGSSFAQWLNARGAPCHVDYYGHVILGDPFLRTFEQNFAVIFVAPYSLGNGTGNGKAAVTISGYRFDPGARVWIEKSYPRLMKKYARDVVVVDSNTISCTLNLRSAKPGAWDVVVKNPDGKTAVLKCGLTVNPHPVITRPATTYSGNRDTVKSFTITGANFAEGATVKLTRGSIRPIEIEATVESVAPNEIKCRVDLTGAQIGTYRVVVTNKDGGIGTPNLPFKVL